MIVFDKSRNANILKISKPPTVTVNRRIKKYKQVTKSNKEFLRALGLKT